MGGGSGQGMQTSGGMTVYNQLGYDPSQVQGGGYGWGSLLRDLGTGAKGIGKGLAAGETSVPQSQSSQIDSNPQISSGQYNPSAIQLDPMVIQALTRLLGGR